MLLKSPPQCLFHLLIYTVLNNLQSFRSSSLSGVRPHAGVAVCVCVWCVNKQTQTGRCSPAGISQVLFLFACRLNAWIRSSACVGVLCKCAPHKWAKQIGPGRWVFGWWPGILCMRWFHCSQQEDSKAFMKLQRPGVERSRCSGFYWCSWN